jgi:hypothetical protein
MAEWDWAPYVVGGAGRPDSFSGMNPAFNSSLQQLFAAAPPEIQQKLRITSGYRSPERQKQLFADAVAKYGSESAARKWVAPPGNSKHNHGVAADLKYLGPEAITWAHENAGKYGLHFPLANENWHIEPIGSRNGRTTPTAIPAQVQVASAAPAVAGPTTAPVATDPSVTSFFGDVVAPTAAPDFGSVVAAFLQNRQRRDEQDAADQARRNALFSQNPFG